MIGFWFFWRKTTFFVGFHNVKSMTFFWACLKFAPFLRCFHGTVVLSGWSPSFALFFVRDHPDQDDLICFSFWNLRYFLCVIILLGMISFILVFEIKLQLSSCDHLLQNCMLGIHAWSSRVCQLPPSSITSGSLVDCHCWAFGPPNTGARATSSKSDNDLADVPGSIISENV